MTIGQLCLSLQGHDNGTVYMVVGVQGSFVMVVDGKYKKQANPKRKNDKHLKALPLVCEAYNTAKAEGKNFPDCEIMHFIKTQSVSKNFDGGESSV